MPRWWRLLALLLLVTVVPLLYYGTWLACERSAAKEKLRQDAFTRLLAQNLAQDIAQRNSNVRGRLAALAPEVAAASTMRRGEELKSTAMRQLLEKWVLDSDDVAFVTMLNTEHEEVSVGRIRPDDLDDFIKFELHHAFSAAMEGRPYTGRPLAMGFGKEAETRMVVSVPVDAEGRFLGMLGAVINLRLPIQRLQDASTGGLVAYVVDRGGRLVASGDPKYRLGQDMTRFAIVGNFLESEEGSRPSSTESFTALENNDPVDILGTYSAVPEWKWGAITQKAHGPCSASLALRRRPRLALLMTLAGTLLTVAVTSYASRRKRLEARLALIALVIFSAIGLAVFVHFRTSLGVAVYPGAVPAQDPFEGVSAFLTSDPPYRVAEFYRDQLRASYFYSEREHERRGVGQLDIAVIREHGDPAIEIWIRPRGDTTELRIKKGGAD